MNTAQMIQKSPAKSAGFEIEDLDNAVEATHKVAVIKDEDGEPVTGFIIVGKNSQQYQNATAEIRAANIQRASKRSKQIDTATEAGSKLVAETLVNNERVQAMAVVVGWFGFNSEGAPLDFNKAMVEKMLLRKPTWVEEITKALDNDANFI